MNRSSTNTSPFFNVQSVGNETLAAIHESAKQRAQTLRREAISGLIDYMIAWFSRKPVAKRQAITTRHSHTACAA